MLSFGESHATSGEEIIRIEECLRQEGLIVSAPEHAQIGKSEGDERLATLGDTIAGIALANVAQLGAVQVERSFPEQLTTERLQIGPAGAVLLTSLGKDRATGVVDVGTGVLLDIFVRF